MGNTNDPGWGILVTLDSRNVSTPNVFFSRNQGGQYTPEYPGSQGFEAKMRMLAEIRLDNSDRDKRHLCIVKGNYIPNEEKEKSFVLNMNTDTLLFERTGERVDFSQLGSDSSSLKGRWLPRCCEIKEQNPDKTVDDIYEILKEKGFTGSRSTVGNYLREC